MQVNSLLAHCFLLQIALADKLSPTKSQKSFVISEAIVDVINKSFLGDIRVINIITAASSDFDDARTKELMNDVANAVSHNMSSLATVRVGDLDNAFNVKEKRFYNVILISDYKISTKLNRVIENESFDFYGFFLVVMVRSYENLYKDMEDIFRDMWQHFIVNVNILISISDVELEMFSFYPFTAVHCGRVFPVLKNKFVNSSFVSSEKFFDDKLKNLFKCPLTVVTFNIEPLMFVRREKGQHALSGVEGELLNGETL